MLFDEIVNAELEIVPGTVTLPAKLALAPLPVSIVVDPD